MARPKNDGKGRLGGREKGTPNKVTTTMREWLTDIIDMNREQMVIDLASLEPKERLMMLERFMAYVIPKQQSIKADVENKTNNTFSIEERLRQLAFENNH